MKKPIKITLISIGSLLALVVILVAVACWLLFTPARLTGIVGKLADKYLLCESHFESVDLSLFKTFPEVGLKVHNVAVINPKNGAPNDTLACVSQLTVAFNLKSFIKDGSIVVRQLLIDGVDANLFIAHDGTTNFDIFPPSEDTTATSFQLPENIDLHKIALSNLNGCFIDDKDGLSASLDHLDIILKGDLADSVADLSLRVGGRRLQARSHDGQNIETLAALLDDFDLSTTVSHLDLAARPGHLFDHVEDLTLNVEGKQLQARMCDSLNSEALAAQLSGFAMALQCEGSLDTMCGRLRLDLPDAEFSMGGVRYVTPAAKALHDDLLTLDLPFKGSWTRHNLTVDEASLALAQFGIDMSGAVSLPYDTVPTAIDLDFSTNSWNVSELLAVLPPQFRTWQNGMDLDADISLKGSAMGEIGQGRLPLVAADLSLKNGQFAYAGLPYKFNRIGADLSARLDFAKATPSTVKVGKFDAYTGKNHLSLSGTADDVLRRLYANIRVKGDLVLADLKPLLPDTLPLKADGTALLDMVVAGTLDKVATLDGIKADGTLKLNNLDVHYDAVHAASSRLEVAVKMPAAATAGVPQRRGTGKLSAGITGGTLTVDMPTTGMMVAVAQPDIVVALSNFMDKRQPLTAAFCVGLKKTDVVLDSLEVHNDSLNVKGSICYDVSKKTMLEQLSPDLDMDLRRTVVNMSSLPEALRLSSLSMAYNANGCVIRNADVNWGISDYHLSGKVEDVEKWLANDGKLNADVNFTSRYTDVDQLMAMFSGMGTDKDTLAAQKAEASDKDANPFIVPTNMDVILHTNISRCLAFGNNLSQLAGDVSIKDGVAVLDQVGFVCKAARMQLTAVYKSPRFNHLFAALDFHLLDIQIDELIDMIPSVDTLVPMLASFKGNADFHLAAETYLNARYQPKMSTLLGSAALSGKNLVVLDNETFDKIASLLMFKKKTENIIDSLDVEMTVFRNELELYPFLLSMDKYQVCAAGRHSLDNRCNYHLELLKSPLPLRLAVDVKGTIKKPKIELGTVKYADLYKPEKQNQLQARILAVKKLVRESLEANVKQ